MPFWGSRSVSKEGGSWEGLNFPLQGLSPGFPRWGGGLLGPLGAAGLPGPEAGPEPVGAGRGRRRPQGPRGRRV